MNPPDQHGPVVSDKEEDAKDAREGGKMRAVAEKQAKDPKLSGADAGGGSLEDLGRGGD